jgi:APA family basic amino acid/polyamine antiporter
VGFVAGWLMLGGDIAAGASVALGFGGYFAHLVGTPVLLGAVLLVLAAAVAMYAGIRHSVAIAALLTAVEAAGLLLVIGVGLPRWSGLEVRAPADGGAGVLGAAALIFFAYLGFDELGNLAEEMRAPERDLPRALFVSVVATTLIYVAVALSATAVVAPAALGASSAPLALVVGQVLGGAADLVLTVMALAATANTVLLLLVSGARSVYGMADAGVLPRRLSGLTATRVPREAMLVVLVVTLAFVGIGDLARAAHLTDAMVLLSFLAVNLALAWLAARARIAAAPARRPLDLALSTSGALMCAGLLWYGGALWILAALGVAVLGLGIRLLARTAPR